MVKLVVKRLLGDKRQTYLPLRHLEQELGPKTGAWLYRVVRGVDDEPVKCRDKSKSCLAFKSFAPVSTLPGLKKWVSFLLSSGSVYVLYMLYLLYRYKSTA